jgi:hypothetical protein
MTALTLPTRGVVLAAVENEVITPAAGTTYGWGAALDACTAVTAEPQLAAVSGLAATCPIVADVPARAWTGATALTWDASGAAAPGGDAREARARPATSAPAVVRVRRREGMGGR